MILFTLQDLFVSADATKKRNERGCSGHLWYIKFLFSLEKKKRLGYRAADKLQASGAEFTPTTIYAFTVAQD
jgi:hypothetical protein